MYKGSNHFFKEIKIARFFLFENVIVHKQNENW